MTVFPVSARRSSFARLALETEVRGIIGVTDCAEGGMRGPVMIGIGKVLAPVAGCDTTGAGLEVQNQVAVRGLWQMVGDKKSRAPLGQPLERFDHCPRVFVVETGGRFVEDQNWRRPDRRACD